MKSYYIYTANGKLLGPMDETAVRSLIEANMLSADTQICLAGTEDWLALAEIFPADSGQQSEIAPNETPQTAAAIPIPSVPNVTPQSSGATAFFSAVMKFLKSCFCHIITYTRLVCRYLIPRLWRFVKWLKAKLSETEQPVTGASPQSAAVEQPAPVLPSSPAAVEQPVPVLPPPPAAVVQPAPVLLSPFAVVPPQYIRTAEIDPVPMQNLNWGAFARKYWTFKGRISGKTFLKSSSVGLALHLIGAVFLFFALAVSTFYQDCKCVKRYHYESFDDVCPYFQSYNIWYCPVGLIITSSILSIFGLISMYPPTVRRMKDRGWHWALIIPRAVLDFLLLSQIIYCIGYYLYIPVSSDYIVHPFICEGAILLRWVISVYVLSFVRGQYFPNRFGPIPQDGVTPWKPCKRIVFVGFSILLMVFSIIAFCSDHGEGKTVNTHKIHPSRVRY